MPLERDPANVERGYLQEYADLAGARVLEIGCGEGRLIWQYAAQAAQVVGMDPDATRLWAARWDCPPALREHVRLVQGQAERLPFPATAFNRVLLGWSL